MNSWLFGSRNWFVIHELRTLNSNSDIYKYVYNAKTKNIEDKIPDITNLATNASVNAKINEVNGEIPSITNLAIIAALTPVENKIPTVVKLLLVIITIYYYSRI